VSEVDVNGQVLSSFIDVATPHHLSLDSEGHVLVADCRNHRVLLLNSQLQLLRVLVDSSSKVQPWWPRRLCYNELTSQLYVLHGSSERWPRSHLVSIFNLEWITDIIASRHIKVQMC